MREVPQVSPVIKGLYRLGDQLGELGDRAVDVWRGNMPTVSHTYIYDYPNSPGSLMIHAPAGGGRAPYI